MTSPLAFGGELQGQGPITAWCVPPPAYAGLPRTCTVNRKMNLSLQLSLAHNNKKLAVWETVHSMLLSDDFDDDDL